MDAEVQTPIEGVQSWTNLKNGFRVVRVHYTADPAKRNPDWIAANRAGMPVRGWKREYEINFACPEGEPVIPEFDPAVHVKPVIALRGCRVVRGWDPGYVSPAVVIGQVSAYGQLLIMDEINPFNTVLENLVPIVRSATLARFPDPGTPFDAGDPATNNETDLGQVRRKLGELGVRLHTTRPGTSNSYESLSERMKKFVHVPGIGLQPGFLVHPRCQTLITALSGAFHRRPHPPYNPNPVHPYKDIVDALRYLNDNLEFSNTNFRSDMLKMSSVDRKW